jgi:hypothetical protein
LAAGPGLVFPGGSGLAEQARLRKTVGMQFWDADLGCQKEMWYAG